MRLFKRMKPAGLFLSLFFLISLANAQQSSRRGITTLGADTIHCPDILQGDTVEAVFYIHNYGTDPVKIYQVHPGCQCTAPSYHDSLLPGQTDSIILVFYSRKHHEPTFMKDAIVLNNIEEKNYYVSGKMTLVSGGAQVKNRRIRITNATTPKKSKP